MCFLGKQSKNAFLGCTGALTQPYPSTQLSRLWEFELLIKCASLMLFSKGVTVQLPCYSALGSSPSPFCPSAEEVTLAWGWLCPQSVGNALCFQIRSSGTCSVEITAVLYALSAAASLRLSGSHMSSVPARLFPQRSLSSAQTQASCLELGALWSAISKFHPGDRVKVPPKLQWCC